MSRAATRLRVLLASPKGLALDSKSHGSARPSSGPPIAHRVHHFSLRGTESFAVATLPGLRPGGVRQPCTRPPAYRGCSRTRRRRGIVRTASLKQVLEVRRARRAQDQPLPAPGTFVTLELEDDAYSGIACWSGGPTRWAYFTVSIAYDLRYNDIRPQMCNGGIAKKTLVVLAAALARYADRSTGRNCRPSNAQLALRTGLPIRTVQRGRECLRLLGVATEVLRGRQRTYIERMASWRMGVQARGWASVWSLHDNAQLNKVIHTMSSHLGRSHLTTSTSPKKKMVTTRGGAPRSPRNGATRRRAPDKDGLLLARAWRASAGVPRWALRYTTSTWAGVLAKPAAAGWTARDLTQLVRDWLGTGQWIADSPERPVALLGAILAWHLRHNTIQDRPSAADEAREAQELHTRRRRAAAAAAESAERRDGRERGIAALSGPGRAAALAVPQQARKAAAERRAAQEASAHARFVEQVELARLSGARRDDSTATGPGR